MGARAAMKSEALVSRGLERRRSIATRQCCMSSSKLLGLFVTCNAPPARLVHTVHKYPLHYWGWTRRHSGTVRA
eukprot:5057162-Amphidinium_carterae.1